MSEKYFKIKEPQPTDWIAKEKRELFCKTVNTWIMKCGADKDPIIESVLKIAKEVVDKAFEHYPEAKLEEEEEIEVAL